MIAAYRTHEKSYAHDCYRIEERHLMEVLSHPNAALKQKALPVDPARDSGLADLCRALAETMYAAPGVGIAAPQMGVLKRVIVYDISDEGAAVALCNPEIVETCDELETDDEGCLSLPGITVPVERPARVVCEALTMSGKPVRIDADGFHARVLQHEIDHLDGVLIIDRATPDERKAALQRYREAVAAGAKPGETSI
jgi:peptide deformylase